MESHKIPWFQTTNQEVMIGEQKNVSETRKNLGISSGKWG